MRSKSILASGFPGPMAWDRPNTKGEVQSHHRSFNIVTIVSDVTGSIVGPRRLRRGIPDQPAGSKPMLRARSEPGHYLKRATMYQNPGLFMGITGRVYPPRVI